MQHAPAGSPPCHPLHCSSVILCPGHRPGRGACPMGGLRAPSGLCPGFKGHARSTGALVWLGHSRARSFEPLLAYQRLVGTDTGWVPSTCLPASLPAAFRPDLPQEGCPGYRAGSPALTVQ